MSSPGKELATGGLMVVVGLALVGWLYLAGQSPGGEEVLWSGVDETVVEKYAAGAGRQAREPLINTDRGDLLLFVFALGGVAGGFVAGYCWRLISEKNRRGQS